MSTLTKQWAVDYLGGVKESWEAHLVMEPIAEGINVVVPVELLRRLVPLLPEIFATELDKYLVGCNLGG